MDAMPEELKAITTHFPRFWNEAGVLFTETLYEESGLDRKTIELILCSLLAARRWKTGVQVHVGQALDAGASPREIRGALLISGSVSGQSAPVQALDWAEPILAATEASPRSEDN